MSFSRATRGVLLALTGLVLLFIHAPLALVVLNSFNVSRTFEWPPPGYTTQWWSAAADSTGARKSRNYSTRSAAIGSTCRARRAGRYAASKAAMETTTHAVTSVNASPGAIPNK